MDAKDRFEIALMQFADVQSFLSTIAPHFPYWPVLRSSPAKPCERIFGGLSATNVNAPARRSNLQGGLNMEKVRSDRLGGSANEHKMEAATKLRVWREEA